ncbi:hypothetical protein JAAARDRAFT_43120 [Jaapia argillacea MUCL 33604]|uniref:Uncharacterized protein n=1 Tax=Jaapia argillacea MUCL 33604 TaxID=933084 RepID=A0A067PDF4_9AGAM|nr:hypothetical protein JAAARDRAFT_43120 [Jaapia argillacea MUCL 33604]
MHRDGGHHNLHQVGGLHNDCRLLRRGRTEEGALDGEMTYTGIMFNDILDADNRPRSGGWWILTPPTDPRKARL